MKKWENERVVTGDHYDKGPDEIIKEMGEKGWEFVHMNRINFQFGGRYQELFFKREIQANEPLDFVI